MAIQQLDLSGNSDKRAFILVAGEAGIGKTSLLLNLPIEETLYVSAEKGELSVQGSGYSAVSVSELNDMFQLADMIASSKQKYIVIDTLTEIYEQIKDDAKTRFTVAQNFAKHDDIEYWFMQAIKKYRDLDGKDVIMLCHVKDEKNGPILEKELCFQGQLPSKVRKQFDVCIHYDFIKNKEGVSERKFITSPQISKLAKCRISPYLNVKVNDIESPNIYEFIKKLKGEK